MDAGGLIDLQGTSRLTNGGWQEMNWTNNKASMNIASGATLDVWDGQDVIIDALTGSGTVDKVHGGNSPRLLKVGIADGSGTFSGTIMNTGGQLAFTKTGTGTQTLSGTNTYSGATTVSQGTLKLDFSASGGPADHIVNNTSNSSAALSLWGGKLQVVGEDSTTNSQRFNGVSVSGAGQIEFVSGASGTLNANLGSITRSGTGTLDIILPSSGSVAASVPSTATGVVLDAGSNL